MVYKQDRNSLTLLIPLTPGHGTAAVAANNPAFETEQQSPDETMLASAKDMEIRKARRMGMGAK